ncbi:MAG: primosomal protein N' [Gammaproteobacteria bacterium]|nr:MAG: primosomal protein N' [Gammaproteobacteria bacterium]
MPVSATSTIKVAVPTPLRRQFDYLPPKGDSFEHLQPGMRVLVPFGKQKLVGIITLAHQNSETDSHPIDSSKLKRILKVLDSDPVLQPDLLSLCTWASNYYQHPFGEVLSNAIPVALRKAETPLNALVDTWATTQKGQLIDLAQLTRAPRQLQALQLLREHPAGLSQKVINGLQVKNTTLRELAKKGLAECHEHPHTYQPWDASQILAEPQLTLNKEQASAVEAINTASGFQPFLLNGVTGSGKTEVYLQAIAPVLAQGKQVLVLVPEIGLTPQTLNRFRQRFLAPIAALHSNLTDKERLDTWRQAREGAIAIVMGTRSALFTPMHNLGLIIIDEEHDASYKQQEGFRYSARDLAIFRARQNNVPIVLGSATPSLESLHNCYQQRYTMLRMWRRAGNAQPPAVSLIDLKHATTTDGLTKELQTALRTTLKDGNQGLIFLNRRGFAPVLMCHDCGWSAQCKRCDARMTYHRSPPHLHCHHCDHQTGIPKVCPECHSTDIRSIGQGTERLEDALEKHFPKATVIRIDRDTTSRKHALANHLKHVQSGKPCLLVGTQMLAKGHHFPKVTLVAIMDIDAGLFASDFRAPEHTAQLIEQVAGRAGRADKPGKVLIQTHHPDHPLLETLLYKGYNAFADTTLAERKIIGLPPHGYLALLRAEAAKVELPQGFLHNLSASLQPHLPASMEIWGPVPTLMQRKAGRHRFQLVIKSNDRPQLHHYLRYLVELAENDPLAKKVKWHIDVDPLYLE